MERLKYATLKEIVYMLLHLIPPGKVTTYKILSEIVGKSPRLIGKILSENKNIIVIPCHRVVKHNGHIGGYSLGIRFKEKILALEGVKTYKKNNEIFVKHEHIIDLLKVLELR